MRTAKLIFCFLLILSLLNCSTDQKGAKKMSGTVGELIEALKPNTNCIVLGESNETLLLVTPEYGARILAVSVEGLKGKNLIWANPKILSDSFWTQTPRDWNLGGARTWIAPEDLYYLDEGGNWFVPNQMDPGNYQLVKHTGDTIICSNEFNIKSKKDVDYHVQLVRSIRMLKSSEAVPEGVKYVGFEFTHDLVNLSDKTIGTDMDYMGLWSLIQINPGGTMILPINEADSKDAPPYRDYFNIFPPERLKMADGLICVKIDGQFRGKIGIAPWAAKGAVCYLADGYLIIKEFPVDPDGSYLDHPWGKPSDYGDAVQMYNDDGNMGGFGEMECHAPASIIEPNDKISHTCAVSFYTGDNDILKKIAEERLGIDMAKATIY